MGKGQGIFTLFALIIRFNDFTGHMIGIETDDFQIRFIQNKMQFL